MRATLIGRNGGAPARVPWCAGSSVDSADGGRDSGADATARIYLQQRAVLAKQ